MAIEDPLRVIGSFVLGSMLTGAIVGAMGIGLSTPGGRYFLALFAAGCRAWRVCRGGRLVWRGAGGTMVSTAVLLVWRRQAVRQGKYTTDSVMP
ncbi:Putative PTS system EIIABC component [Kluyvera cryocrescens]|uniref:PTS system EIIABC component n=1 Tax=Kluyvera cryocrescens TaxID=580 RepID=A0A485CLQ7_KLUCR|nr:Putative PTS system EIIABC component [Kluyvera cryocrescens]